MADLREPDRIEGAPHPRETRHVFGQSSAERTFLDAFANDRLHHGWLLTGQRGIGKATLAWRIARFLLAQDGQGAGLFGAPDSLDVDPEHPVSRRIAAGSEPGLLAIRRAHDEKTGKLKSVITVDEVRKLRDFFAMSSTEGGRRIVIVDAADEMNPNAANALLKLLEEPPHGAVLLLVAHQPSRLLPTIRSRCRTLRLNPLGPEDMDRALAQALDDSADAQALAQLSGGSVGESIEMLKGGGIELYVEILKLLDQFPKISRPELRKLCDSISGRDSEPRFHLLVRLFDLALSRLARTGAMGAPLPEATSGEAALMTRLAPNPQAGRFWAEQANDLGARARTAKAVNLDPGALVLDMFLRLESASRRALAG